MGITYIRPGQTFVKDPDAELIYGMDWAADGWLAEGVAIATSTWTITGPDSALTKDNDVNDGSAPTVRLKAGTAGATYRVMNRIITDETPTQKDDRSFFVTITDR